MLQKNGSIYSYKTQIKYPMIVKGKLICNHIVDFEVYQKCGFHPEIHEVKSKATMTAVWRIKHKLFLTLYPSIKYIVVSGDVDKCKITEEERKKGIDIKDLIQP